MSIIEPSAPAPVIPKVTVGDRIRIARRHAGLTQPELAEAIVVGEKNVSNWEAGVSSPRNLVDTVELIAKVTNVDAGWILRGIGSPTTLESASTWKCARCGEFVFDCGCSGGPVTIDGDGVGPVKPSMDGVSLDPTFALAVA